MEPLTKAFFQEEMEKFAGMVARGFESAHEKIEAVRQELKTDVTILQTDVTTLKTDVALLDEKVTALDVKVTRIDFVPSIRWMRSMRTPRL